MAIVEMSKLSVIGLNDCKAKIIKSIMDLGVVEINNQDAKLTDENWNTLVEKDGDESAVYEFDAKIAEVSSALEALNKYDTGKKPLFKVRKPLNENEFNDRLSKKEFIESKCEEVNNTYKELTRLKNEETKINTAIIALNPWVNYELSLDMNGTKYTSIFIGTMPVTISYDQVCAIVEEKSKMAEVYKVASDADQSYLSVVCLRDDKDQVLDALRLNGFNPITFNDTTGKASENIKELEKEIAQVREDISEKEQELSKLNSVKEELELLHDDYIIARDKAKILSSIVKTKSVFYFDGWLPTVKEEEVKKALDENGAYYEITEPEKGEETPIMLKQNAFSEPFEAITNLYGTPSINDIDPTPFLAPFYFIFFGLMLSDAGYGIMMTVGCIILLKMFRFEGMMKKLIKMFMYCGISTTFWGIMFGGWFGDFIPVVASTLFNKEIVINPVWFNPIENPMLLLAFSLILGGIHIFVGLGLKAYILIKNGNFMEAVLDIFVWYIFLIGLVFLGLGFSMVPPLKMVGTVMSIFGAVVILFTGGRKKKGIFGKITGGLGSLYGTTSYLSDVLSYSRLLALGLATGVIAQVINTLGSIAGGGIKGAIVMIIAFFVGHVFNFAINVLGSFVHSSRLQYVEFFGKFFEGGGKPFNPFGRKTKYVDIIKEEK